MPDAALQRFWMTFVIVGAGPTGVELAGQIRELAGRSLTAATSATSTRPPVRVILVDGGPEPLANVRRRALGPRQRRPREDGRRAAHGPARRRRRPVRRRHRGRGRRKGLASSAGPSIWAAGVQASPLAGMLAEATGAETDRAGQGLGAAGPQPARAPRGLRRRRHGVPQRAPGVCEVAMQGGLHAANTIKRQVEAARTACRSRTVTSGARRPSAASRRSSACGASA